MAIYTYQDLVGPHDEGLSRFITSAIDRHESSARVRTAKVADLYDHQMNRTINEYVRTLFTLGGSEVEDYTASNSKIASNFFNSLNTQRVQYSLGNGVSFASKTNERNDDQTIRVVDTTKDELGAKFDDVLYEAGYDALKHKMSSPFTTTENTRYFR